MFFLENNTDNEQYFGNQWYARTVTCGDCKSRQRYARVYSFHRCLHACDLVTRSYEATWLAGRNSGSTNGKNLRGKLCGAPRWEFHGGIRKGEDRRRGANENSFAFGENARECVQGLSVIESSQALLESICIYNVTSDVSIIQFEYSNSPRARSRFLDSLKCYHFIWYVLCDNYYEEVIYYSCKRENREIHAENKYDVIYKMCQSERERK